MEDLEVTVLGSSSAVPLSNRSPTSQFITMAGRHFLIDCGEGTQVKLRQNKIGFGRINHIFISHLHGDHFYGLVPLLTTLHLLDRHKKLHLYGPANLEKAVKTQLELSGSRLRFPMIFHTTDTDQKKLLYEDKAVTVHSFPLRHSLPCCGFLFTEKEKPRNMRKDKIQQYNIPTAEIRQIKKGADWIDENGRTISNHELTLAPSSPLSYAFCTDTEPLSGLSEYFTGVDLLYHEATFTEAHKERAVKTQHTTAKQAAEIARQVDAKRLLLGHFSVRYTDLQELVQEAREIFGESYLALEQHKFVLKRAQSGLTIHETPRENA